MALKYPTAAFAAVGAPEKPFHSSDLGTPCCETKVRALRNIAIIAHVDHGKMGK